MLVLMNPIMKPRYRLFRRKSGVFYIFDRQSNKRESLETKSSSDAQRLLHARNEAQHQPLINRHIARAYLMGTDHRIVTRTWQEVMEKIVILKKGPTRDRWEQAIEDRALDSIRSLPLLETRADHFLEFLSKEKSSTNAYLRLTHHFTLGMDLLLNPVIPRREWPPVVCKKRRSAAGSVRRTPGRTQPTTNTPTGLPRATFCRR